MTEREAALENEVAGLKEKLAETQRQLDLLVRHVFGKRSEQTPPPATPGQFELELEMENAAIESAPPAPPRKPKGGSRKGRKVRGALWPEHLPVEETVLIPACVQAEPDNWRRIGQDISERLEAKDTAPRCGLLIVDIDTGVAVEWLRFEHTIEELYDVAVLPGVRQAEAVGFRGEEIQRTVTLEG